MAAISSVPRRLVVSLQSGWPYLAITAAVLYVYFQALFFDFVWLDDNVLVIDHQWLLRTWANIGRIFTHEVFYTHGPASYYRPMLTMSFMLDAHIGGIAPFMYHLTNVLLHAAASCLVFAFLTTLNVRRHAAFALSLIFCVHPVLTQAVAWVPGRNDSLLALFALPTMMTLVRFWQSGKVRYLLCHCLFFCGGLFTKESMAFFPFIGAAWMFFAATSSGAFRDPVARLNALRNTALVFIGWFLPGALWYILRKAALANPIHYPISEAFRGLIKNAPSVPLYIGKVVFPFNLSALPTLQDSSTVWGYFTLGAAAVLLITAFVKQWKARYADSDASSVSSFFLGLFWFLLFLVPSLVMADASGEAMFFEHRIYVPMAGLLLAVAQTGFIRRFDLRKVSTWAALGACVYVLSIITRQYEGLFSDRITFYEAAVRKTPRHAFGHKNLAAMYYLDGKMDLAEKENLTTLQLNPYELMVHNNLGEIYKYKGDTTKAKGEYEKELAISPDYAITHFNLGHVYYHAGKKKDAEKHWLKAHDVEPDFIPAIQTLYTFYRETGDTAGERRFSRELSRRGIPLTPDSSLAGKGQ